MAKNVDVAATVAHQVGEQNVSSLCVAFRELLTRGEPPIFSTLVTDKRQQSRQLAARALIETLLEYSRETGLTVDSAEIERLNPEFKGEIQESLASGAGGPTRKQLGDYELRCLIGRGSMGQVWLGWHKLLKQPVAIKLIQRADVDRQHAIDRFEREMAALGKLNHPHIVQVRDARHIDEDYFLVMEFVDGMSLDMIVQADESGSDRLSVDDACEMVRQAASGLQYAYECGVVHRDIKPSNLILTRDGTVKILDFGLARMTDGAHVDNQLTDARSLLGTLDYMAPEQFDRPDEVGTTADIYSLGCTLYCLLSGKPPYADTGSSPFAKADAHRNPGIKARSLSGVRKDVDSGLWTVIRKMIAKQTLDRFQTPVEVCDALAPWCGGSNLHQLADQRVPVNPDLAEIANRSTNRRSGGGSTQPTSSARRITRRRFNQRMLLGGALALTGGAAAMFAWPRKHRRPELVGVAAVIGTLPSLRGNWWFDEIPEFLPPVRQAIVEQILAEAEDEANPNNALISPEQLEELTGLVYSADVVKLEELLRDHLIRTVGRQSDTQLSNWVGRVNPSEFHDRAEYLAALEATLLEVEQVEQQSPTIAHLIALLHHRLALLAEPEQRLNKWSKCESAYDKAIAQFRLADTAAKGVQQRANRLMWDVCLADRTTMYMDRDREQDARTQLRNLLGGDAREGTSELLQSPLVQLFYGARLGTLEGESLNFDKAKAAFDAAKSRSQAVSKSHPLRAFLDESCAWCYIDDGGDAELKKAIELFENANEIRLLAASTDKPEKIFKYHNDHGIAVAQQWQDNTAEASKQLLKVTTEVSAEIFRVEQQAAEEKTKPGRYLRDLIERFVNSSQRLADCYLFGKEPDFPGATEQYSIACETVKKYGVDRPAMSEYSATSRFRKVISLRMSEGLKQKPSAAVLEAYRLALAELEQITDPDFRERFQFLKLCTDAIVSAAPTVPGSQTEVQKYVRKQQEKNSKENLRSSKIQFAYLKRDDRQLAILLTGPLELDKLNGAK